MEILRLVLLFVHLVAIAGLLGGLLAQHATRPRVVTSVMVWSARILFLAGLLLVGVLQADDKPVDNTKIAVKLVVALVVVGLVEANRRKAALTDAFYYAITGLVLLNIAVAIFWSPAHGSY